MSRRSRLLPICMTEPSQVRVEAIKKSILLFGNGPKSKWNFCTFWSRTRFPPSGEHRKVLFVSLPRLPASHKRCKVAWFGDAGGSETIETIPNIILIRIHFISQLQQRWWNRELVLGGWVRNSSPRDSTSVQPYGWTLSRTWRFYLLGILHLHPNLGTTESQWCTQSRFRDGDGRFHSYSTTLGPRLRVESKFVFTSCVFGGKTQDGQNLLPQPRDLTSSMPTYPAKSR